MKRLLLGILLSAAILFGANAEPFAKTSTGSLIQPGKVVVKYKSVDKAGSVNKSAKIQIAQRYNLQQENPVFNKARNSRLKKKLNLNNVFTYEVSLVTDIEKLAEQLNADPNVEYAEPVYISQLDEIPNDPLYNTQQHLPQVSAPEAWDDQYGNSSVIIGIIDSGVDWDHEDLANVIWTNTGEIPDNGIDDDGNGYVDDTRGWDFVYGVSGSEDSQAVPEEDSETPDNDPMDFDGHGTHVSGIAAAETNNNIGIASVSSGALVMPLRCGWHGNDGLGYVSSTFAAEAYIYAADNGAVITNQSSGNSGQLIVDGAFYAFQNGVLIVESAGNSNIEDPSVLGSQSWVISVASLDPNDVKSSFSNFGNYIDISAPGSNILSTILNPSSFFGGSKYVRFSGTSMAAPLVASVAGLVKAKYPNINVIDLYTRIMETADNIDAQNPSYVDKLGAGKVNAYEALSESIVVTSKPRLKLNGITVNETTGNSNNILEPGENANLSIEIENTWAEGSDISASLSVLESWPVTITDNSQTITSIGSVLDPVNSVVTIDFPLTCDDGAFPTSLKMQLLLNGNDVNDTLSFYLSVSPQVIFVADFESASGDKFDFTSLYTSDLKQQNIAFDYAHTINTDITYELLSKYDAVIWGCEWTFPSLTENNRTVLKQYLDNGGALFLSGQDIGWDLNENEENLDIDFFNNYLKANYIADDGGFDEIIGIDGDPISNNITSKFYQINRDNDQQFPDVISPLDGASPLFTFTDGSAGAIKYRGNYDLVYFSFGGYESILDENARQTVLKRIFNWFSGVIYNLQIMTDSEDTESPIPINITIESEMPINSATLYYNNGSSPAYTSVNMSLLDGNNSYQGIIPAQKDVTITYFVSINTYNDKNTSTEKRTFYVGADTQAPTVESVSNPLRNSINVFGPAPYELIVVADDIFGIDPGSVLLNYWVNSNSVESVELLSIGNNEFTGTFSFNDRLAFGDVVNYFFSAIDLSSNRNYGTSDTVSYIIDSVQVVDDFELNLSDWNQDGEWGLSPTNNSGNFSLSESPSGSYENNTEKKITYLLPFNLSVYNYAQIEYYMRANLERNKDYIYLELSNDSGNNWNKIDSSAISSVAFEQRLIDISEYAGVGNEDIRLRFRFVSDESGVRDGVWIDDITLRAFKDSIVSVEKNNDNLPIKYSLSQNYPNPFNPSTTINFAVPIRADVKVTVYNVLGEVVSVLADATMNAGSYSISFDAANKLSSGIYLYRISAIGNDGHNFTQTKKMMLIK